jgi:glycosyltransferase involved in cell wall biosynthesis
MEGIWNTPVNFICTRVSHHSAHSGYDRIADYLGERLPVPNYHRRLSRPIPWRIATRFVARSGMSWYSLSDFYAEVSAALRMLRRKNEIYHFVYGENSYRYLRGIGNNRIICTYHQPPSVFTEVVRDREHVRRLDAIVVVARSQVAFFGEFVGEERVFLVPLGVDTAFFRPGGRGRAGHRICLSVGQWLRDFEMLRRAIEVVNSQTDGVEFVIVTSQPNYGYFDGLGNVTLKCGIPEEELLRLYQDADLFLLPLLDATANLALLEAMACGLPIVVTDVGGVRDYVDEGCAILVRPGDAEGMAKALLELLSNELRRREMARHSREKALEFDWKVIAERMKEVYRCVV